MRGYQTQTVCLRYVKSYHQYSTLDLWDDANEDWFSGQGATEEEKQIARRLRKIAERSDRQTLPALGWVQRKRLTEET